MGTMRTTQVLLQQNLILVFEGIGSLLCLFKTKKDTLSRFSKWGYKKGHYTYIFYKYLKPCLLSAPILQVVSDNWTLG